MDPENPCRTCGHAVAQHAHLRPKDECSIRGCGCLGPRPTRWWHRLWDELVVDGADPLHSRLDRWNRKPYRASNLPWRGEDR